MKMFLLLSFLLINGAKSDDFDPATYLNQCLDEGSTANQCTERVFVKFTEYMETGLPHLGLQPMDPLNVPEVNFKFFDATVEFKDVALRGFKDSSVIYSEVNPETRKWKIGLNLPALRSSGVYKLYGTIPPNLDLDTSTGDVRLKAKQVDLDIEVGLGIRDGDKLEAKTFDLNLALDDINVEMECLFPRNGRCCPRKFLKSCNSILAKTVLRFINNDGKKFVKDFQPEIARQTAPVLKDYLNTALRTVKAEVMINV